MNQHKSLEIELNLNRLARLCSVGIFIGLLIGFAVVFAKG